MIQKPEILVLLGEPIHLEMAGYFNWEFNKKEAFLCSTPNGKELWIIPAKKKLHTVKKSKKGQALFRQFTGWKGDTNYKYSLQNFKLKKAGNVDAIAYRSNKWDRKTRGYIHEFEALTKLEVDNLDNPKIFRLTGKFLITAKGIEG